MKYGYNDNEWMEEISGGSKFCKDVISFNTTAFIPFMKRKSLSEIDMQAFEDLLAMVEMMKNHLEEVTKK